MQKKIILLALAAAAVMTACQQPKQQHEITIRGSVQFPLEGSSIKVILQDGFSQTDIDSIFLSADNTFEKKVKLPKAGRYMLSGHQQWLNFWGEDEDIEVNFRGRDTAKVRMIVPYHLQIENSGPNNELMNLISFFNSTINNNMYAVGRDIYAAQQSGSQPWMDYMTDGYDRNRESGKAMMDYLGKYYRDRNSVMALLNQLSDEMRIEVLAWLEANKPAYPPYVEYKEARAYEKAQKEKLAVGNVAPDFSYPTPEGNASLGPQDFRGKYLLVDFWASWCGPCRKSMPMLKEIYAKYHDKGFEILSISIDKDEKAWRKAMEEENMAWPQVIAPEAGKDIQKVYQFNGIPHVLLLDREGKIVVREIYGDDIAKAVAKVFEQN